MKTSSINSSHLVLGGLVVLTLLSGAALMSSRVSADDSVVDDVSISVPVACSMSGSVSSAHSASLLPGTYSGDPDSEYVNGIGSTTLTTFCNDYNGFSIYAIGYTNDTDGNNTLLGSTTGLTIPTGVYQTSDTTSSWSMKVTKVDDSTAYNPDNMTIVSDTEGIFSNWHTVPADWTKVAEYKAETGSSATDTTLGGKVTTTYAAFVSTNQVADTYEGQVKYIMVHPYDADAPIANPAMLDTGKVVNSKLKSLAATVVTGKETVITPTFDPETEDFNAASDNYVKSINVHLETPAPAGFTPTGANTISSADSANPVYIIFDNTDDAGIMNIYTEGKQIVLPEDSSYMFYMFLQLSDLSDLSSWNASNVTDMNYMFGAAGLSASTFTLNLSGWNTSNVTDMSYMFSGAGRSATTYTLGLAGWNTSNVTNMSGMFSAAGFSAPTFTLDLSSWNTSNATNMSDMFIGAGYSATTFALNLSGWNTSNVTDMSEMFDGAGYSATTFTLNLSGWNTSNVTDMSNMFRDAGSSASTWSVTIPQTNGNGINNTTTNMYGQNTSIFGEPESGKSFTLAQ